MQYTYMYMYIYSYLVKKNKKILLWTIQDLNLYNVLHDRFLIYSNTYNCKSNLMSIIRNKFYGHWFIYILKVRSISVYNHFQHCVSCILTIRLNQWGRKAIINYIVKPLACGRCLKPIACGRCLKLLACVFLSETPALACGRCLKMFTLISGYRGTNPSQWCQDCGEKFSLMTLTSQLPMFLFFFENWNASWLYKP